MGEIIKLMSDPTLSGHLLNAAFGSVPGVAIGFGTPMFCNIVVRGNKPPKNPKIEDCIHLASTLGGALIGFAASYLI